MKSNKLIICILLLSMLTVLNINHKDTTNDTNEIENFEINDTNSPVHTEYDGIALVFIIAQFVLIGGGVGGYFIYKKKKDGKEIENQKQNKFDSSNHIVFYSSYDMEKKNNENKTESNSNVSSTSTFTSNSTSSSSSTENNSSN